MTENKNIQVSTLVSELEKRIEVKKIEVKKEVIKKKIYDAPHPTSIFALGGLEEIGKNTYCIEYDDEIIMLDAGVKFPNSTQLGVSAVVPDYSYLVENKAKLKGLFITHGHEDHIGGIPYLLQNVTVPVIYAPPLAAALIRDRIKEFKLQDATVVRDYEPDDIYATKHFKIEFCAINHSIPDSFGIRVETPNGAIFSTGDYKFDWTPLGHNANIGKLAEFGKEGVELLMADSTNAEVEGYTLDEKKVIANINNLFLKAKGRIIISSFASNVHRLQHIVEIANKYGRRIAILGRSIERIIKIIRQMGHMEINDKMFIKASDIDNYPKNQIMILCTGSQGEPMAALSRISRNEFPNVSLIPGDTVILSSSPIPGNRADVELIVNKLSRLGAIVIENGPENRIHTSGHASQEEQKVLFTLLKPKFFMPMHGEYRMLKTHGETATKVNVKPQNVFVVANGDKIVMHNGAATIGKRVEADAVFIDGKDLSGQANNVIRERNILSRDGLIAVIISIDSQKNKLTANPRIISRGSFYVKDSASTISEIISIVSDAVTGVLNSPKPTFGGIKNAVKESLSPYIFRVKKRNPLIIPVILNKK